MLITSAIYGFKHVIVFNRYRQNNLYVKKIFSTSREKFLNVKLYNMKYINKKLFNMQDENISVHNVIVYIM
jgi:hypothetical protein